MATQPVVLYRALLRFGRGLKFTDQSYFYRRIRFEFEKNRLLTDPSEISLQLKKGEELLRRRALV